MAHRFATPAAARTKARRNPAGFLRSGRWVLALAVLPLLALANDRPYQETRTAIAEDDDNSWSVESWVARRGGQRSLSVEPEYSFDPRHSVQMEFSRSLDRDGAGTGHAVEIEYKYLFNRFDRDGYGAGLSLALGADRLRGDDGRPVTAELFRKALGEATSLPVQFHTSQTEVRVVLPSYINASMGNVTGN